MQLAPPVGQRWGDRLLPIAHGNLQLVPLSFSLSFFFLLQLLCWQDGEFVPLLFPIQPPALPHVPRNHFRAL